mgnify:CR=1 FL=1
MFEGRPLTVVVPAHNEERLIEQVLDTMPSFVDRIVVVDDASTDATMACLAAVLGRLGSERLRIVKHDRNRGVGAAIVSGYEAALEEVAERGEGFVAVMAGDAQMDPDYLPALLDPIVDQGYGFTKANRFYSATSFEGMPKVRVFGNIVLTSYLVYWR